MKIVITGGAGFIGSHLVDYFANDSDNEIVIVDNMGYAANYHNIAEAIKKPNVKFVLADICNFAIYDKFMHDVDVVIHTAAESHVDNSFFDPLRFVKSNVEGTQVLLHACKTYNVNLLIHFSTDEVYGGALSSSDTFDENHILNPTNPYAASKAAAEMMVMSYVKSFSLPVIVVRPNNVYGIRQHWEKLIPTCCMHLKERKKIPIHGRGEARRDYLSVYDLCDAIALLIKKGDVGETYNIGINDPYSVKHVATLFASQMGRNVEDCVIYVKDRLYNDSYYPVWSSKIAQKGWTPKRRLETDCAEIHSWYTKRSAPFAHGWFKDG